MEEQSKGIQELHNLQNQLHILHNSSDIAFDHGAQMEYVRIQEQIKELKNRGKK